MRRRFPQVFVMTAIVLFTFLNSGPGRCAEAGETFRVRSRIGLPLLDGGVAYFGTEAGSIHAVDLESGKEVWRIETGQPVLSRPAKYMDLIIIGGQDGELRAIYGKTGVQKWHFSCGEVSWQFRDKFVNGSPTIRNGVVYFSSEDHNVYALDAETGEERWQQRLGEEPQALELPIVDDVAYIGAWDGYLYAIDILKGEIIWKSDTDTYHIGKTEWQDGQHIFYQDKPDGELLPHQAPYVTVVPIISDREVYFTDWAGNLIAVNRSNGKQLWRFKAKTIDNRHAGSRHYFIMHGDVIYFSTMEDKHLYGVDRKTGKQVWQYGPTSGWLMGPLLHYENMAIFPEIQIDNGRPVGILMHGLNLESKEIVWTSKNFSSFPWLENGVLYHGGMDGTFHGTDLKTGMEVWQLGHPLLTDKQ